MKASKITGLDFFDDLSSPYARKRFFWGFIAFASACIALILLERAYLCSGGFQEVIEAVLVNVLTSSLIIIFFYSLYLNFIGPNLGLREVTVTRPRDIRERLEALTVGTKSYTFWGRSGSYFRSTPLRKLDAEAKNSKYIIDVDVLVPDPNDERLIQSYREIRDSLGEPTDGNPLLLNVLATAIVCATIDSNNKYIRVKLYKSKFLPAFRVDMSDNGAILTQDDPAKSALFFEARSEFHEMFRTTVRNEISVSEEIKWDNLLFVGKSLTADNFDKECLNAFGFDVTEKTQEEVSKLIKNMEHRYK